MRSLLFILALTLAVTLTQAAIPATAAGPDLKINARAVILAEAETGLVLYEKNPDLIRDPASLTKIMTMYVVFTHMTDGSIDPKATPPISARAASTGGSTMFLSRSDTPTVVELLFGLAVWSGNDAAVTLAEYVSGGVDDFVTEMNKAAREMGLTSTTFKTPTGLTAAGQHTTPRDMLTLTRAYLNRFPGAIAYHQRPEFEYQGTTMENTNPLLGEYRGADGVKTGHTGPAGFNLVATAKRDGVRLIAVILGAGSKSQREADATLLLDTGFALVESSYLVEMGDWKDATKARQTKVLLDRMGYRSSLDESRSGQETVLSLLVGPYADVDEARTARDDLLTQGFSPRDVLRMTLQGGGLHLAPVREQAPQPAAKELSAIQ